MTMPTFTMRQLLEAGVHFGHTTRRWNPKMKPFIFGSRNNVHILDLEQTVPLLYRGLQAMRDIVANGGRVLFVGTKRQAAEKIKESFEEEKNRSSQLVEEPKKSKYLSFKLEGILESPVNLCVTYDPTKFGPFVIGRSSIPEAGLYSVCCAIQNLWLSARTEGIGLGWVSILSNETLKEVLDLPEHVIPVAYLCLGHVDEFADKPDLQTTGWLPRLKLKDVVYFEKWDDKENKSWKSIQEMLKENLNYA